MRKMKDYSCTYDPADNKLRMRAVSRLPRDLYDRVRAAGFIWAPKQELFVAPMWTPDREDLMLELCEEIEDEDTSLVERAEQRAERFEHYSDNRKEDADQAHKAVESICNGIPLGQPILVGHHSERRARKDAERIENGMRKAIKMWDQSKYWADRAVAAKRHAKYLERPDVRARRIKKLEAEKRKQERGRAEAEHLTRFWEGKLFAKNPTTGERRPIEITQENRAWLCELLGRMPACGVSIRGLDGQGYYSAWDILRPDDQKYGNCPTKTVAELQSIALRLQAEVITRCNRWINHYTNRIAYEQAMLDEDGGTVTDRKGFVALDDRSNDAAKVATKTEDKSQESTFDAMRETLEAGVQVVSAPQLFPTPLEIAKQLTELAFGGSGGWGVQVGAEMNDKMRILEPSAGTGNILTAIKEALEDPMSCLAEVCAVELNLNLADGLAKRFPSFQVMRTDFLTCNGTMGKFDRILMNPPFANGADIQHIKHALNFLAEGGRLVAICANGPRQQEQLKPLADQWIDLGPGAFDASGTRVNAAMLVINK